MTDEKRSNTKFWLGRCVEELLSQQKKAIESISILNHQLINFDKMSKSEQDKVIDDLNKIIKVFEWDYEIAKGDCKSPIPLSPQSDTIEGEQE